MKELIEVMKAKGYPLSLSAKSPFKVNLVAVRNKDRVNNTFNDLLFVLYHDGNNVVTEKYKITTDPGLTVRNTPVNSLGTAIVLPGTYPDLWKIGLHKGQYKALVQNAPVTVVRDNDKDSYLNVDIPAYDEILTTKADDGSTINSYVTYDGEKKATVVFVTNTGYFGINCHRAHPNVAVSRVNYYSAGCFVFESAAIFNNSFLKLCTKSSELYGNKFSMSLLDAKDIPVDVFA